MLLVVLLRHKYLTIVASFFGPIFNHVTLVECIRSHVNIANTVTSQGSP